MEKLKIYLPGEKIAAAAATSDACRAAFWELFERELEQSEDLVKSKECEKVVSYFIHLRRIELYVQEEVKNLWQK